MKVFFVLSALVAAVVARPGGYIAIGGVYQPSAQLDYMDAAKKAGQVAWNTKFESELDLQDRVQGKRQTEAYVPTFFTSQSGHQQLLNSRPASVAQRTQRHATAPLNNPLYRS